MSDTDDDLRPSPKRSVQREYAFQQAAIIYLRRVLVPPAEAFAIINESQLSQNARARAKSRGAMPGVSDIAAIQRSRVLFLELKIGSNKPSDAQLLFKQRMLACGVLVAVCWSVADIYSALSQECFELQENAYRLIHEFDERVGAAIRRAELRAQQPHKPQRAERPTQNRIRKAHAAGVWRRPLLPGEV